MRGGRGTSTLVLLVVGGLVAVRGRGTVGLVTVVTRTLLLLLLGGVVGGVSGRGLLWMLGWQLLWRLLLIALITRGTVERVSSLTGS